MTLLSLIRLAFLYCLVSFCPLSLTVSQAQNTTQKQQPQPLEVDPNTCYERTTQSAYAEICDETGEWVAVICRDQASTALMFAVYEALATRGHARVDKSLSMNEDFKQSLITFQETHHLPVGGLNLQTLELLQIDY